MGVFDFFFVNTIQQLPPHIANQIAAGEVVQRPASAVKELAENAIDAGASRISFVLQDGGRTLISITDNGNGIPSQDVPLAFERHATSKLRTVDDLFALRTMGFRGEALASIAAISHVECLTRTADEPLGTHLFLEGGTATKTEKKPAPMGTYLSIRNLFFNVPARRQFLKSDPVEFRAVLDVFTGLALAHPHIGWSITHNGREEFHLEAENDRSRLLHVLGKKSNDRIVPVQEATDIVQMHGFIFRPEHARKTRGDQHLFVNKRMVRSAYLHRAVVDAFEGLIAEGSHPAYVLFLAIDPARIDVNVHPAKTEIKFDDERAVYAVVRSAVKHALGQYQVAPGLDFEAMTSFHPIPQEAGYLPRPPQITVNPDFNPFLFENQRANAAQKTEAYPLDPLFAHTEVQNEQMDTPWCTGLPAGFIATVQPEGLVVVHTKRAQRVIAFERFLRALEGHGTASQQLLFPVEIELSPALRSSAEEQWAILTAMGFDGTFTADHLLLHGIPVVLSPEDAALALETWLQDPDNKPGAALIGPAWRLAQIAVARSSTSLRPEECVALVTQWQQCHHPWQDVDGATVALQLNTTQLQQQFS